MYINNEKIVPCKYHENYYISRTGHIYSSYIPGGNGKTDISRLHELKYSKDKDGYYRVVLSKKGHKQYKKIHTLMVEQFIRPLTENDVVNHIDGNKQNNCIDNLEITTVKGNTQHAHKMGCCKKDVRINVIFNGTTYYFPSMASCISHFPDLSIHYLNQIRKNTVIYSMVLFTKEGNKINAYYNGLLYKTFDHMQDADAYFHMKKGSTSAAIKTCNRYRKKINMYTVIFPNISTIESTDNNTSGSK